MQRLAVHLAFDVYIKLTRQFNSLAALGLQVPGSDTKAFFEYTQSQCNCCLFWRLGCLPTLSASISRSLPSQEGRKEVSYLAYDTQQKITEPGGG
jgi:hypothetical protein